MNRLDKISTLTACVEKGGDLTVFGDNPVDLSTTMP